MSTGSPESSRLSSGCHSRRSWFQRAGAGCAALTNTSLVATLLNLQATKSAVASSGNTDGYKALVCLFLFGGNDSHNMLIPADGDVGAGEYGDYHAVRGGTTNGGIAIPKSSLLPITGPGSRGFGLHPGMPEVVELYNQGNLSFLANIGSLVRPTNRADYNARVDLPVGLFSHSDLQRHWMTSVPQTRSQITGWAGRMADVLTDDVNLNPTVSMNISINGMNLFQTGGAVVPYTITQSGATQVAGYGGTSLEDRIYSRATDNLLDLTYSDLLAKTFAETSRASLDAAIGFNDAVNQVQLNTAFSADALSQRFKMIAQVIGSASQLQQTRQVFFISQGGFDLHSNLINGHAALLPQISRALRDFHDALVELGCENDVVTFTASDFARTLSTNGQGSDHGWGANQLVMGGGMDGGKILGDYPTSLQSPQGSAGGSSFNLDVGRGRLIPTMSVDELSAELAMWFGVENGSDLEMILPNIREFYSSSASGPPLGILL